MVSPLLLKALRGAPKKVRALVEEVSKSAPKVKAPRGTGSLALDLPLTAVPPAKRQAARASAAFVRGAERLDIAAGERLKKVPGVGKIFKTKKTETVGEFSGGAKLLAEVPVGKATQPATATMKHVVTPLLAFMGAESLIGHTKEEPKKMAANVDCGHEEVLRKNEATMRKAAAYIERLEQDKDRLATEFANHLHETKSKEVVAALIERGHIDPEDREAKVAEFVSGKSRLSVASELLSYGGGAGTIPPMGEVEKPASLAGVGVDDEATLYLQGLK